jgi:hypothetical protein
MAASTYTPGPPFRRQVPDVHSLQTVQRPPARQGPGRTRGASERTSTLITSNRPVEDWGKLLGDTAAVAAMLDRLLHHAHVLTCGPKSWRTRLQGERAAS